MIEDRLILEAVRRLLEGFRPQRIILFGSQARGTAASRSDVDLLVVCSIQGSRRALMVAMDRALRGLRFARDVIVLTPEEYERDRRIPGTVARPASQEGRILYEHPG
jgi:predicted nucleotidyltransferase